MISHDTETKMPVYKNKERPCDKNKTNGYVTESSLSFNLHRTHIDAPLHMLSRKRYIKLSFRKLLNSL